MKACRLLIGVLMVVALAGCAGREMVVDLYGSIIYEKPQIRAVSHTLDDGRRQGGVAVVRVSIQGDPGLAASFDIYPGIVERYEMQETSAGNYTGEFRFLADEAGGSFTITGRLEHAEAGEVVLRDPDPLTISRANPR